LLSEGAVTALIISHVRRERGGSWREQDFSCLDAQREAAEAYIARQRRQGWTLVPEHFDDGGFSGASL
jgi:site-specific DNA recombinase